MEGRQDGVDADYEMAMRLALHSLKSHPSREHAEDFAGFGNFPSKEESPLWQQRQELVSDMMLEDAVYKGMHHTPPTFRGCDISYTFSPLHLQIYI